MRGCVALLLAMMAALAGADRIILIPVDSRPASGQFAQMIGDIAHTDVVVPPLDALGRFTQAGSPEAILAWLKQQDFSDVTAVVASTDMIAYGGLIPSRSNDTSVPLAVKRLKVFAAIRESVPNVKFYGFSAIMRLAPTATRATSPWRLSLGKYAALKEQYRVTRDRSTLASLQNLLSRIPAKEVSRYEHIRARNHRVQQSLIRLTGLNIFDYLVFGQDDAQPIGPHIPERSRLQSLTNKVDVTEKVYFAEGIDQHPNVLVSRALLKKNGWTPRIKIVFADNADRTKVALYESKTIEQSVRDQVIASGARPMSSDGAYDYTLFLNTPDRSYLPFQTFVGQLIAAVDSNSPVCVADINLGRDGTADPELYSALWQNNRLNKLLAYAGWNTAGNTMGTAIPAANVYLVAKRIDVDPYHREVAQREFLLHRLVNDYAYHKYTRPYAYRLIDSSSSASREEAYGEDFQDINTFVRKDLGKRLDETFRDQFLGRKFVAGNNEYVFNGLDHVRIFLPWPRAYEVRLEFRMTTTEVGVVADSQAAASNVRRK